MDDWNATKTGQMEATQAAIRKAFRTLDLPADIRISREGEDSHFEIDLYGGPTFDWNKRPISRKLPPDCLAVSDVANEMHDIVMVQANAEFRDLIPDYRIPHDLPVDPDLFAENCHYVADMYGRIETACLAAEKIEEGEREDEVYQACKDKWAKRNHDDAVTQCGEHLQRMDRLYGQSLDEAMAILKDFADEKSRFPVPGRENQAVIVRYWGHIYDFTKEEFDRLDTKKEFPRGFTSDRIDIDGKGIITSDGYRKDTVGKRFHDAYPLFRCEWSRCPGSQTPLRADDMKDEMLVGLRKMVETYQKKYGVSDKEIDKALKKVRKELPDLAHEKPQGR
ncbi:hypothetical protein ACTNCI_05900 [Mitsuokella jalaludinii]|uniref:hypothetical protein n=1 Tax=Mitsuokella jalaludinii TaxID=187979 RepID=UPI003F89A381